MTPPERSAERDAAIEAMLPHVPFDGWTLGAVRRGLASIGAEPLDAALLFPGGVTDMIEAFCDWADRRMEEGAAALDPGLRLHERVRAVIALRLEQNRPFKEAVRRALVALAMPGHARKAVGCTARTVDSIWHAAGDRSSDFSWYTKRAILAGVYGATLAFWLSDSSEGNSATWTFLGHRIDDVMQIEKIRSSAMKTVGNLPDPFGILRAFRGR